MASRSALSLGLVGFGEVGSLVAGGLAEQGLEGIHAFDPQVPDGQLAPLIQRRAADTGVRLVSSPRELADSSTLILNLTPGGVCVDAARAIAGHLSSDHVYVDLAAASPAVKRDVGDALAPSGALAADGAIMSPVLHDRHRTLILASGPGAQMFLDAMSPWHMRIEHVGTTLGAASAIKSMRSVLTKGLEALLLECVLASTHYGIEEAVLKSFFHWVDATPFATTANMLLVSDAIHAGRRAHEARESAETIRDAGLNPVMTTAAAEVLEWSAALDLRSHFGGEVPESYAEVIEAIQRRRSEEP